MQRALVITVIPGYKGGIRVAVGLQNQNAEGNLRYVRDIINVNLDGETTDVEEADVRLWINHIARAVARALENDLAGISQESISRPNARSTEH